jgi:predicted ester cyclase
MSIQENKELIRRYFGLDATSDPDLKHYNEIHALDYQAHGVMGDMNLAQSKQTNQAIFAAFPDFKFTIEDILAEGDKVTVRYSATGTHQGPFMGVAPTSKKIILKGISIYKIANGKLVESWGTYDRMSLMQQLGAISQTGKK